MTGKELDEAMNVAEQSGQSAISSLSSAVDEFVRSGKRNFSDFARSVLSDLAAIQLKAAIFGSGGSGSGGIIGSIFGALLGGSTASYAGGGYTGGGSRSGGIDGQGGFPAILHPNETVVDHSAGSVVVNQTVQIREQVGPGMERAIAEEATAAAVRSMEQIKRRGGSRRQAFGLS